MKSPEHARLAVDLQACQTPGSANRGVGRYSTQLFQAILQQRGCTHTVAVVGDGLPYSAELSRLPGNQVLRLPLLPNWGGGVQFEPVDALAYSAALASVNADVVHVSHVFEGLGQRVPLPARSAKAPGQLYSATLYDLIPLHFASHYLSNPVVKQWYLSRLEWLRTADLLLAISDSSRNDAIQMLGVSPEAVVTIHGGIGPQFMPTRRKQQVKASLRERFGLRERFILYTGGDDHRKNLDGAIRAYARLPGPVRRTCMLVIVCAMTPERQAMYLDMAQREGLLAEEVRITGFVSEEDLVAFYQCCDAFVFPSLYEGLGLPVLEAMACGAPVIGSDNSSIQELIGRPDAMFDARSAEETAMKMARVLSDDGFAADLSEYGLKRHRRFTWEGAARRALEGIEQARERSAEAGVAAAIAGWMPHRKMAMLTPLPPARSGIADYNAAFLPFLRKHFDVDLFVDDPAAVDESLRNVLPVDSIEAFEQVAGNYDVILYEFGNSEFHTHMVRLLQKFPGVVGLHDAFLSGLFGYFDFYLGDSGSYSKEMLYAHGPRARRYFAPAAGCPEPNGESMVTLPCTKRVVEHALGLISHSPFNLELANESYPEGWWAPYRIIPQMVRKRAPVSADERAAVRRDLGFTQDDLVVATFGHIAWTKWGDKLLEAFVASKSSRNPRVHLVYVGELAQDDFGRRLAAAIEDSGLDSRIRVTGFLAEDTYAKYLRISDLAFQLRTKSRGGTPKGVLDCLAWGVPVVVNNDASYRDYPDDVVHKLPPEPSIAEIAQCFDDLIAHPAKRELSSTNGRAYVETVHDPARAAAAYSAAIHEFCGRQLLRNTEAFAPLIAPHLADCEDAAKAAERILGFLASVIRPSYRRRKVYVDVSHITEFDHRTGIQRVVREITSHMYRSSRAGFEPVAVRLLNGRLTIAGELVSSLGLLVPQAGESAPAADLVDFQPGDVLLMLDSSWARIDEFQETFKAAREARAYICTVVYDLLPLTLPEGNFVPGGREWFASWLSKAVVSSDYMICISRSTAEDLINYIEANPDFKRTPGVGWWHLGGDFAGHSGTSGGGSPVRSAPYMLMVGTLEPRKSHALALQAFEELWKKGSELGLCIAGKQGWMTENLMETLRKHPERNRRLFLFESPSDAEVSALYREAEGLLFLSKGEGFGLPLIEAAHYGTPIVCTDLPVFREIAGDFATYLRASSPDEVAEQVSAWWKAKKAGKDFGTHTMPRLSWEQSCNQLLDVILDQKWMN